MLNLFDGVVGHKFAENVCFLCGSQLPSGSGSVEHVIPKWLQKRFALWDVRVHLLNGTSIKYSKLVVPCCQICNNVHLAKVEQEVCTQVAAGPAAVLAMDRIVLMQWLLKMLFGFLYRELFLPLDRRYPAAATIVSAEDMEQFQMLHYLLQSTRVPMTFHALRDHVPASIFVFEVKEPAEVKFKFDYKDDVINRCLQIRMGSVGILAAFDMGFQAVEGSEFFPRYSAHALHPLQFNELAVNLFSKARKLTVNPFIFFSEGREGVVLDVMPPGRSPFDAMTTAEQAEMLAHFTGLPLEVVMPVPDRRITFLENDDGSFRDIPIDAPKT